MPARSRLEEVSEQRSEAVINVDVNVKKKHQKYDHKAFSDGFAAYIKRVFDDDAMNLDLNIQNHEEGNELKAKYLIAVWF